MFIFTEIVNCGMVGRVMLNSYHQHHQNPIHVFGTPEDFDKLGPIKDHKNNVLVDVSGWDGLLSQYATGHRGTARIFAEVFSGKFTSQTKIIHIDSDIFFKKESLNLLIEELNAGIDIVGSCRAYKYNPGKAKGFENYHDTVSTYFFGFNAAKLPGYDLDTFTSMCEGTYNPLHHPCLDFFDPVTFVALQKGANIKFIDNKLIGGQHPSGSGSKENGFTSNLHFDCGSHLVHFGGAGSGFAYLNHKSRPHEGYAAWAAIRYEFFHRLFLVPKGTELGYPSEQPAIFDDNGRWIDGYFNEELTQQARKDIDLNFEFFRWQIDAAESLKYELNRMKKADNNRIFDVGGFKGDYSKRLAFYNANTPLAITIFEPVKRLYYECSRNTKIANYNANEGTSITVNNYGISNSTRQADISLADDNSSLHIDLPVKEQVQLYDIAQLLTEPILLLKLNVEGEEYNILERLIQTGRIKMVSNILVQFHHQSAQWFQRRTALLKRIEETHCCQWCYEWIWELWSLR